MPTLVDAGRLIKRTLFQAIRRVPLVERKIQSELGDVLADVERKLCRPTPSNVPTLSMLPEAGVSDAELESLLAEYGAMDEADLAGGKVSGTVYGMNERLRKTAIKAFDRFLYTNPLHPDVFPSVRRMEAEVVAMTASLFHGVSGTTVGTMTSGGTESILLACKGYRDWARTERGILYPELIVATSAHAAFEKAANYFGIELIQIPTNEETGQVDLEAMQKAITWNTIALVASAPSFAHGVIDDVPAIARLAMQHGIGCHVDCCLGSFLIPFLPVADEVPFDFCLAGVTSISCDPHKYGYTPKGSSVILYRSADWRKWQYFVSTDWTGGIYASPTLAGSRSGATIAATWAVMVAIGKDGYRRGARQIEATVRRLVLGIQRIPEIRVVGNPVSSVVAIRSDSLNIYAINDVLSQRGWHLNPLQNPPAIHIACTLLTTLEAADELLSDLSEAVAKVKSQPLLNLKQGSAAIYGTAAVIPDKSIIADVACGYMDALYKL